MNNQNELLINNEIEVREILPDDIDILVNAGFPAGRKELVSSLTQNLLEKAGLNPRKTKLVAYSNNKKSVVGFLSLFEHTPVISSIKYVFTDPNHRKMGIATQLINHAFDLAKKRGAKKIFLNFDSNNSLMNFYANLGFTLIVEPSMLWGCGFTSKHQYTRKETLFSIDSDSIKNKELLFNIYKNCMGDKWVHFFETKDNNIINGFSQDFKHLYSKSALVSKSGDFFALVFKRPVSRQVTVELYAPPKSNLPIILEDLFSILYNNGIGFVRINLFNVTDTECFQFLTKKKFYPFQARIVGKHL